MIYVMKTYQVEVVIKSWEEGGYLAEAPALQGCWVVAPTVTQAMEEIVEVVQMHIDIMLERGEPLPKEVIEAKKGLVKARIAVSVP